VVTPGRQKVDTWGALSGTISPRDGGQSISKAASIESIVHSARDISTQTGILTIGHYPCVSTLCLLNNHMGYM